MVLICLNSIQFTMHDIEMNTLHFVTSLFSIIGVIEMC